MNRQQYLVAGTAAAVTAVAGCLGGKEFRRLRPGTGRHPGRSIDTDAYETKSFGGIDVPLAPLEDVHYWYQRQEARIVDTRGRDQHDAVRITGSVLSSAPDGVSNDPVATWPEIGSSPTASARIRSPASERRR